MKSERIKEILEKIKTVRVAAFGDICIDIYWHVDMRMSELSRETPHFAMPVVKERLSLGGGGNVLANMAALCPRQVLAGGLIGDDWRGREIVGLMEAAGIDTRHIVCEAGLISNAFCKPLRRGITDIVYEDPRLDFANVEPFDTEVEERLISSLDKLAASANILCISDQLPLNVYGAVTKRVREHILSLAKDGLTVVVDSRDKIGLYTNAILKPNEVEGARAVGLDAVNDLEGCAKAAQALAKRQLSEVIMTVGEKGSIYVSGDKITHIPAQTVTGEIDIVGAGDSFISGFALALAAGASRPEAAYFAGLCSAITIKKIGTTGTASPEEIISSMHP